MPALAHGAWLCHLRMVTPAHRAAGELCLRSSLPSCRLQQGLVSTWFLTQAFAQALRQAAQSSWSRTRSFKGHPCRLPSEASLAVMYTCQGSMTGDSMIQQILKAEGKGFIRTSLGVLYATIKQLVRWTKRAGAGGKSALRFTDKAEEETGFLLFYEALGNRCAMSVKSALTTCCLFTQISYLSKFISKQTQWRY